MADWSQLPTELLTLIAQRLETRFAVLRFRSVCPSWRSSIPPPKHYPLPKCLPSINKGRLDNYLRNITRNTFYLVRLPETSDRGCCWLVKIRDGTDGKGMRLMNPLSDSELKPFPVNFPNILDLSSFQVIELGHEFVGEYDTYIDHPLEPQYRERIGKVTLMWFDSSDFMMLALFGYVWCLAFLRSGEKAWTLLEKVRLRDVQDTISFNGKFYAIEQEGRTIVVDQSLDVSFLELVGSPNSRMFLVQSGDKLLAVEMIFRRSSHSDRPMVSNVYGFRIFRLDTEEKKWDEIESLGDQILFLISHEAIAVPASEFSWGKGNLIFYRAATSDFEDADRVVFVFDLENGNASPLENCPTYLNLVWSPPEWVTSTLPKVECKASDSVVSSVGTMSDSSNTLTSATADAQNQDPATISAVST